MDTDVTDHANRLSADDPDRPRDGLATFTKGEPGADRNRDRLVSANRHRQRVPRGCRHRIPGKGHHRAHIGCSEIALDLGGARFATLHWADSDSRTPYGVRPRWPSAHKFVRQTSMPQ
jgi:hypothetical protein